MSETAPYEQSDSGQGQRSFAAVDLGSNSFHMVVAQQRQGEVVVLDRLRERVGLAEGLQSDGGLDKEVAARALLCLKIFGERLKGIPEAHVRAVGTATFRDISDGRDFMKNATKRLGHEIETLPGREEARLIYLGVAHNMGDDLAGRLVFDIGGGSTEIIVGKRFESLSEASVSLGCIHHSAKFFSDGKFTEKNFNRAILAARLEVEPTIEQFTVHKWKQAVGASGTILAIADLLAKHCGGNGTVTPAGLQALIEILCRAGHVDNLNLAGLAPDRHGVLAGGLAILAALLEEFGVEQLETSGGALREGLLYDLLGRMEHEDVRHRSVMALAKRFGVQMDMAERVARTAMDLFQQVKAEWGLKRRHGRILGWATLLCGIGRSVSYSGYHRHGAYLVANSDMPGFSSERQAAIANLVRHHRRRARSDAFSGYEEPESLLLRRLSCLIRIAHRIHRVHSATEHPVIKAKADGNHLHLKFPDKWIKKNRLAQTDLELEAERLLGWGLELTFA